MNGQELKDQSMGCSLSFKWIGTEKKVEEHSRQKVADEFHANKAAVKVTKRIIGPEHEEYKELSRCRTRIRNLWVGSTLPWIENGTRLILNKHWEPLREHFDELKSDFQQKVWKLGQSWNQIKGNCKSTLGDLYSEADYVDHPEQLFSVTLEPISLTPPDHLKMIDPAYYEAESKRVAAKFDRALELAEEAYAKELNKLLTHLEDRLTPGEDGKQKRFTASTVDNLVSFFDGFRKMSLRSSPELDEIISKAEQVIGKADPETLRIDHTFRESLSSEVGTLLDKLDDKVLSSTTNRRRRILKKGA